MNKPIGVITKKKIINIIAGATIFPRISPNLTQAIFNGRSKCGFKKLSVKKIKPTINGKILISFELNSGQNE